MGLLSLFKSRSDVAASASASEPVDAVQQARIRARQRLIGAVVLVIIGIIGFPLVFETQPRPIPVDIPIELPRKEGAPPLVMPPRIATAPEAASDPTAAPAARAAVPDDVITESAADAGREVSATPAAPASKAAAPKPEAKPSAKPESRAPGKPVIAADVKPTAKPGDADAARARDLLEGKAAKSTAPAAATTIAAATPASTTVASTSPATTPATGPGRFVVQVGAFADAAAAQETRLKVEKLGMKTYTQVASTAAGSRIRVRVGPFGSRDEADRALAKARGAGLSAVVLTL